MDPSHQRYQGFLSAPQTGIRKQTIDFKNCNLPEYSDSYACILDNVLSAEECAKLVLAAKASNDGEWQQATINAGYSGQQIDPETRLCGRIIWSNPELVSRIWNRCKDHVPEILRLKDRPGITGSGHLIKDWTYEAADEDSMLEGGATTFHALDWSGRSMDVVPRIGRVLLFQQNGLLHSGADVTRGIKLTMRTDVVYKKVD
ncbi:MAG: hypothetical protein Q9216_005908 [Gyalolechia sp. 2 TL-2023]